MKQFVRSYRSTLILGAILMLVFLIVEAGRLGDFNYYYLGAQDALAGINPYAEPFHGKWMLYYGSPVLSVLLSPFSQLPDFIAVWLWKLLCILALLRSWQLIIRQVERFAAISAIQHRWLGISTAVMAFPIYADLHVVQFALFLLWCCLEGLHQVMDGKRSFLGGTLLAIGIWTKILPIVVLPYLIWRRQWKGAAFAMLAIIVLAALPFLVYGVDFSLELWHRWLTRINPGNEVNALDMNNYKNHGLSTWLASLFIADIRHSESSVFLRRHVLDLGPNVVAGIILFARLIFIFGTLIFLRFRPFQVAASAKHRLLEWSYILCIIPLIFPQQRLYNFVFMLPAVAILVWHFLQDQRSKSLRQWSWPHALFLLASLLINLELIMGQWRRFFWHYKTMTWAALILIGLLVWLRPQLSRRSNTAAGTSEA